MEFAGREDSFTSLFPVRSKVTERPVDGLSRRFWMKVKFFCAAAAVATFMFLLSTPLAAQWLDYKNPGIPRTPDGKPDLSAPVPRTADGRPDLSGVWRAPRNSPYLRNIAVDLKPG